ncbi:MAG: heparan-alpha-glucosaminide N-acetyltransferase domain-containing protein, partial [Muribaculaceae bacterium]|nr:heparan-alpha-glucosaminide N-acetyltransferase domain-containing protein [Muribaculaceae bacterium]
MTNRHKRLLSLDVMRGLTIALMIVVNNQVGTGRMFPFLNHVLWDGLSFADLVFPSFMFIMGVCAAFSLNNRRLSKSKATLKSTYRGIKIIIVGILLTWIVRGIHGVERLLEFETLRLTGVLVRLGICYIFAALIYLYMGPTKKLTATIAAILVAYAVILIAFNGFSMSEDNIIARIDQAVIGCDHMYHKRVGGDVRICFDPEGLLSNLPGIAHVLIGMLCGNLILKGKEDLWKVVARLALVGGGLIILGFFLNPMIPINKNLWTPSFVFATCGGAAMTLAILLWMLDIRRIKAPWLVKPSLVFGLNPLVLYCFSYLLEEFAWTIHVGDADFPSWFSMLFGGNEFGSLAYSLFLVGVCLLAGLPLYLKKIVIK